MHLEVTKPFQFFRGVGLFVGIELVKDRKERTPATEAAQQVVKRYLCISVVTCPVPFLIWFFVLLCHVLI